MTSAAANTTSTNAKRLDERSALFTELYVGPSFRETASHLLRQSLREHYPTLDIDPDITNAARARPRRGSRRPRRP